MAKEYDARLENWNAWVSNARPGTMNLYGNIYDDTGRSFYDGTRVQTSGVDVIDIPLEDGFLMEGTIVKTRSGTRYLLGEIMGD